MTLDRTLRPDLLVSFDAPLEQALNNKLKADRAQKPPRSAGEAEGVPAIRRSLMEPRAKDPRGWERLMGESNLVSINFLDRGRRAADAVCMIRVPAPETSWRGTGFLVGQRLLMTNHHVLGTLEEASQAEAEFGCELDLDGVAKHPVKFNLAPHEIFFTDAELDVTLVSVNRYSDADVPLERYGRLPLIPMSGKAADKEEVSIIQHPRGETKQIAIRASQIVDLRGRDIPGVDDSYLEKFIHYSTDTQPGSSGAPVFNDSWQVIAIHHRAIPEWSGLPKGIGQLGPLARQFDEFEIKWLANEGVRISAIYGKLERSRFSNPSAAAALERLEEAIGLKPLIGKQFRSTAAVEFEKDKKADKQEKWDKIADRLGYREDFLAGLSLPLEDIVAGSVDKIAPLKDGSLFLHYLHFSSAIDSERKFPLITAVNIRGDQLFHPGDRAPWRRDIRIDEAFQPNEEFYGKDKGTVPVEFDRGHLVRRFDPCWGSEDDAKLANDHSFHYTNAAPQVGRYNSTDWGDIEDYVLNQTQTKEKKVSVFTGPIFRSDDPHFTVRKSGDSYHIPISYWKIAVIEKSPTKVAAVGFIIGQLKYVSALYEAQVFSGLNPYTLEELKNQKIQVPIATIEQETDLNFTPLRAHDALDALESTRRVRFIVGPGDIVF